MKLYATTTSERASKGQGGNEYLDIILKDEDQEEIARIVVTIDEDGYCLAYDYNGDCVRFSREIGLETIGEMRTKSNKK